jgi:hypothetical protein
MFFFCSSQGHPIKGFDPKATFLIGAGTEGMPPKADFTSTAISSYRCRA